MEELNYILPLILLCLVILLFLVFIKTRREARSNILVIKQMENEHEAMLKQLTEAQKQVETAKLKESVMANMNHEIRTPLNAIIGFANLITDTEVELTPEEKIEYGKIINTNADLLLRLINDVLDISRIESGYLKFDVKAIEVSNLMKNVYNATRMQIPPNLKFIFKEGEKGLIINVDEGRTQEVLTNFITNACKFTPSGSITLGWNLTHSGKEVELYVQDTGIGLSEEDQKQVFNRFYKKNELKNGTGLGLAISQAIVSRLNGLIGVKSELGKGSRFYALFKIV